MVEAVDNAESAGPGREAVSRVSRLGKVVPVVAGGATAALCLHQVLIAPVVVLANNGDFDRLLAVIGLKSSGPGFATPYGWLHYSAGHTRSAGIYLTSYVAIAGLASLAAHTVLGGTFDIRILGTLLSALLAALVYLFVRSLEGLAVRVVGAAALVVGVCDSRMVAYLNTWFDEPWSLLVVLALVIWLIRNRGKRVVSRRQMFLLAGLAVLLATSKTQNAVLALPLAAMVLVIGGRCHIAKLATAPPGWPDISSPTPIPHSTRSSEARGSAGGPISTTWVTEPRPAAPGHGPERVNRASTRRPQHG